MYNDHCCKLRGRLVRVLPERTKRDISTDSVSYFACDGEIFQKSNEEPPDTISYKLFTKSLGP